MYSFFFIYIRSVLSEKTNPILHISLRSTPARHSSCSRHQHVYRGNSDARAFVSIIIFIVNSLLQIIFYLMLTYDLLSYIP